MKRLSGYGFAKLTLLTALSFGLTTPVFAQAVPTAPPTNFNPGLLVKPPQGTTTPEQPTGTQALPAQPQATPKIEVPETPGAVQLEGGRFMVRHIKVENNTLISDQELQPLLTPYEGKEVTLDELGTLVEAITHKYRDKGYLTSLAYIPPQDVKEGDIVIQVMEGKIGKVEIEGNRFFRTGIIARQLDERPGEFLNVPKLENSLGGINRTQDYRVQAVLSPGENTGDTDVHVRVEERQPWQIGLIADNQGRPRIGTYRWGTEVTSNNLTGIGDRLSLRWMEAKGTEIASGTYLVPVNRWGTEVGGFFGFSHVNVDLGTPNQPKVIGNAYNYSLLASQPLDAQRRFVADGAVNIRRISSFLDEVQTSKDDIFSLQFGLNYSDFDRLGNSFLRFQTTVAPGVNHSKQFWKAEIIGNRVFRLPKNNYVLVRHYSQFTPDALPAAEQYQLGGEYSVRGYTEGLLIGDRGYQFSVEHRWPVPGLKLICPWLAERVQGAEFIDFGQTWLDNSNPFFSGASHRSTRTTLAGAGLGLRVRLTQYAQGFVDFGWGLLDRSLQEPNAQPTVRVHFGVRSDLLPRNYKQWNNKVTQITYVNHRMHTRLLAPATQSGGFSPDIQDIQKQSPAPVVTGPATAPAGQTSPGKH